MATVSSVTTLTGGMVTPSLENYLSEQWNGTLSSPVVGDTWKQCTKWYEAMPGAFFQLGNLFLCLTFMASGSTEIAASYTHFMSMLAFAVFAVWGYFGVCSLDIIVWGTIIAFVNLFQGCEITHMDIGQAYAKEEVTPSQRLGLLLSGRMKVTQDDKLLHYVTADNFLDSAEWFAATESGSIPTFKVTVTADTKCTYISWKRKTLLTLLSKRKRLAKIIRIMIGRDVARKLYQLNDRCINEKGFRYDIRLPCVMSLPDDMERRRKAAMAIHSAPGTPRMDDARKPKHKKLGKTAQAKYKDMFASKLRARVSLRRSMKANRPVVREPIREEA